MAVLGPDDGRMEVDSATLLLVGSEERIQRKLAEAILEEEKDFTVNVHIATSLPLPSERDHLRPKIDMIVFIIDIKSKYSLKKVEDSLAFVDDRYFLGKVCFLATGVGRMNCCSVDVNAVWKLGEKYCTPVLFSELELEGTRVTTAQRLLRMLEICAGFVPGISALYFNTLMTSFSS